MMFFDDFEYFGGLGCVREVAKLSVESYGVVAYFSKVWSTHVYLLVNISTILYTN